MSLRPEISDRAQRDLDRQYRWYLKHAGVEVADGFFAEFHAAFGRLLECPQIGWQRNFRGRKLARLRSLLMDAPYEKYIIYHRVEPECVWVERVIHTSRDIPRRLGEEGATYSVSRKNPAGDIAMPSIS
jgi:plasmid stabilization system protein ParE